MPLEGKTEQICMYNNAALTIDGFRITNQTYGYTDETGGNGFTVGETRCMKLGDVPVNVGDSYGINYYVVGGYCIPGGRVSNQCGCGSYLMRKSSDSGKTFTWEVTGSSLTPMCKLK